MRWADRLLASARFRELASAFPPTRPIARRRAGALFDLATGFVHTQILLAAVRSGLPAILLADTPDADTLAERLRLPPDSARRLLDAAAALRIARRRRDGRYAIGALGAALIGQDGLLAMIEHHALLYDDLRDPLALLRGEGPPTRLSLFWPYAGGAVAPDDAGPYSDLMARSQAMIADEVLAAWPVRRHRVILDIGGGDGAFLERVGRRARRARLLLFDLPPVASRARARFRRSGLDRRAAAIGGDFRTDPLPRGADLATLVRVLHDHDDETVRGLLRRVREALPPGGTLLIAEPMAGTPGAPAMGDAYFGFYLLAMGRGRPRTAREIDGMLAEAGFARRTLLRGRIPLLSRAIAAS